MMELVKYDAMCQAIAVCEMADEAKAIRDKAMAMEIYAKQAMNVDAERKVTEIRIRAERRCGELLAETEKAQGKRTDLNIVEQHDHVKTLSESGISKDQSSKWQKLAKVPEKDFEEAFKTPAIPSTTSIIKTNAPPMALKPMNENAIWLLGRLGDFEKHPVLLMDKSELLDEMTDGMIARVKRMAPIITNYLTDLEAILNEK